MSKLYAISSTAFLLVHIVVAVVAQQQTGGPVIREYNMKEFAVRDLNGYILGFGQELWQQKQ